MQLEHAFLYLKASIHCMFRDTMFDKYCTCKCKRWQTSLWQVDTDISMVILNAISSKNLDLELSILTRNLGGPCSHTLHVCILSDKSQFIYLESKYCHKETAVSSSLTRGSLWSCTHFFIHWPLSTNSVQIPCDH